MANHKFGDRIRLTSDQLLREYIVTPGGRIKTLYYERNVSPALLHIQKRGQQDGRVAEIVHTDISHVEKGAGFSLLKDLYAAEDRMEDWETFLIYQRQARTHHVTVEIADEYLPDEVLRRRAEAAKKAGQAELPKPQRKKVSPVKKAEKKSAARSVGGLRGKLKGAPPAKDGSYEIQRRRVNPALMMGVANSKDLLTQADERDALADGEL